MAIRPSLQVDPLLNPLLDPDFHPSQFLKQHPHHSQVLLKRLKQLKILLHQTLLARSSEQFSRVIAHLVRDQAPQKAKGQLFLLQASLQQIKSQLQRELDNKAQIETLQSEIKAVQTEKALLQLQHQLARLVFRIKVINEENLSQRADLIAKSYAILSNHCLHTGGAGKYKQQKLFLENCAQMLIQKIGANVDLQLKRFDSSSMLKNAQILVQVGGLGDILRKHLNGFIKRVVNSMRQCLIEDSGKPDIFKKQFKQIIDDIARTIECLMDFQQGLSLQARSHLQGKSLKQPSVILFKKIVQVFEKTFEKLSANKQTHSLQLSFLVTQYPFLFQKVKSLMLTISDCIEQRNGSFSLDKELLCKLVLPLRVLSQPFFKQQKLRFKVLVQGLQNQRVKNTEELRRLMQQLTNYDPEITRWLVQDLLSISMPHVRQRKQWAKSILSWVSYEYSGSLNLVSLSDFVEGKTKEQTKRD